MYFNGTHVLETIEGQRPFCADCGKPRGRRHYYEYHHATGKRAVCPPCHHARWKRSAKRRSEPPPRT